MIFLSGLTSTTFVGLVWVRTLPFGSSCRSWTSCLLANSHSTEPSGATMATFPVDRSAAKTRCRTGSAATAVVDRSRTERRARVMGSPETRSGAAVGRAAILQRLQVLDHRPPVGVGQVVPVGVAAVAPAGLRRVVHLPPLDRRQLRVRRRDLPDFPPDPPLVVI